MSCVGRRFRFGGPDAAKLNIRNSFEFVGDRGQRLRAATKGMDALEGIGCCGGGDGLAEGRGVTKLSRALADWTFSGFCLGGDKFVHITMRDPCDGEGKEELMQLRNWLMVAAMVSASVIARADAVYTYTGQDFNVVNGPYNEHDAVSGSFTLATVLGDNLDNATLTPALFSFTDGLITINNANAYFGENATSFNVSTDASGEITAWSIFLFAPNLFLFTGSDIGQGGTYAYDLGQRGISYGYVIGEPGTWTVSSTPEPGSLMLLGTGLLGLAGMGWKRFAPEG